MDSIKKVSSFYDENVLREWERMDRHPIEFGVTLRYMDKYYPKGASILDVGGGPGRYAIHLAKHGHDVTLVDLSENNVKFAKQKAKEEGINIKAKCANVLNLNEHVSGTYDVVQCMGPLYHLLNENDRTTAVNQCLDLLKPSGLFVASFISSYAFLADVVIKYPEVVKEYKNQFLNTGESCCNIESEENAGFTDAYFIHPMDIEPFLLSFPLTKQVLAGVEGIPSFNEPQIRQLPRDMIEDWIDVAYSLSQDKLTWAANQHFLYIGKKYE